MKRRESDALALVGRIDTYIGKYICNHIWRTEEIVGSLDVVVFLRKPTDLELLSVSMHLREGSIVHNFKE